MKRPLYDLIIGNIPGAKYRYLEKQIAAASTGKIPVDISDNSNENPQPLIGAAVTCAQAKSANQKTLPLQVEQSQTIGAIGRKSRGVYFFGTNGMYRMPSGISGS